MTWAPQTLGRIEDAAARLYGAAASSSPARRRLSQLSASCSSSTASAHARQRRHTRYIVTCSSGSDSSGRTARDGNGAPSSKNNLREPLDFVLRATPPNGATPSTVATPDGTAAAGGPSPGGPAATSNDAKRNYWQELLTPPEPDTIGPKYRSASDASVLRRKGHLKEQDQFIEFLLRMHETHTSLEVMQKVERWIAEHRKDPRNSKLKRMVPSVGNFFTALRLVDAFKEYDEFFALSRRQFVPPNFAEIRHVLNIAQVHSAADTLRLVTFDADGTLYADGAHMDQDNEMVDLLVQLMRQGLYVAIVTAAGYPGQPERFEQRMAGLLQVFRDKRLPKEVTDRFLLMGGECNYLLRVTHPEKRLEFVPDGEWKTRFMMSWDGGHVEALLDEAEKLLRDGAARLKLPVQVIRKEHSVGVVPSAATIYEVLEEIALSTAAQLNATAAGEALPFCAFNGGNDVFVDIGNKSLGLEALMQYLKLQVPNQLATPQAGDNSSPNTAATGEQPRVIVLHVGDRFTISGNDKATRDNCSILWVANPEETGFFIKLLLQDLEKQRLAPYIE